jgi:sulfur carrier protein ThiS adenylyltransferase
MITIYINEKEKKIDENLCLNSLLINYDFYIIILNVFIIDFQKSKDIILKNLDRLVLIKKNVKPSYEEFYSFLTSRNSPQIQENISNATVGIAGIGGLGSNIAIALARIGIKKLVIADFDIVEPSNLNRQYYFFDDIGKYKVDALENIIRKFNPYIEIEKYKDKIDENNFEKIFKECFVIAEAFDKVSEKFMIINKFSSLDLNDKYLVCASGLAGFESSNIIKTTKLTQNIYICGDYINEAKEFQGLMLPRVLIASGHQANMILRIINNIFDI